MRLSAIPHKSAAHKLTCLTLYRNLLRQSFRLPPDLSEPLVNLVGQRFHLDRTINSPTVIYNALNTARQALDLIHSAANQYGASTSNSHNDDQNNCNSKSDDETSTRYISSSPSEPAQDPLTTITVLLKHITSRALETHQTLLHQHSLRRQTPSPTKLPKLAHLRHQRTQFWKTRIPNSPPILSRPVPQEQLPNPTKPRRVPFLVQAQGIPFLRYKSGPQSAELSRVITSRAKQYGKLWDRQASLADEVAHAALEDLWDEFVERETGVRAADHEEDGTGKENIVSKSEREMQKDKSWTEDTKLALKEVKARTETIASNRAKMTYKLRNIMLKERTLAEEEKQERKRIRLEAWLTAQAADGDERDANQRVTQQQHPEKSKGVSGDTIGLGTSTSQRTRSPNDQPWSPIR